ncbi:MAG: fimbrillin family protein [Bacteroidaceae bacterium]|nr:fimbrillin family protein [Bacteroidaceae bacterium]
MKKTTYIFLTALCLFASCDKEQDITGFDKWPVSYGYMQFGTRVSTRSHLAESMRGKDFGVIGFKFSETSNWETAKSTATPGSWFYDVEVSCDEEDICSYGEPKQWENYNYAFFAYHPYRGAGINLSSESTINTPMLTYTYGWLNHTGNISTYDSSSPVFDLMTAEAVDVNGSGSGRVDLNFKHRLFAFEVLANNYNESDFEYVEKTDEQGNPVLDDEGKPVMVVAKDDDGNPIYKDADGNGSIADNDASKYITGLTLTLEGLTNTKMTIPLSMMSEEPEPVYTSGNVGKRTFKISDDKIKIPAFNETIERTFNGETEICGAGVATSVSKYGSEHGGYVFLIPQEGTTTGVKGTIDWAQLGELSPEEKEEINNTFTSTITFEPGILYQIHINFVGDGITIALIEAGNWESTPDVEHTFE